MQVYSSCAYYLALQLKSRNIDTVILCPGSRNAPMVDAIKSLNHFNIYAEVDERNAGFMALGLSIANNKTCAVICTSGSAVLNLLPALSEAKHQNASLLLITCDRPTEAIGQQDSQTINQILPLKAFCAFQAQLQNDNIAEQAHYNAREIDRALNALTVKAPVQINLPLADPLYTKHDFTNTYYSKHQSSHKLSTSSKIKQFDLDNIQNRINKAENIVLIIGQLSPSEGNEISEALKNSGKNISIVAENTANIALDGIRCIDPWVISLGKIKINSPDLLISIGGHLVSKKLKHLIRSFINTEIWRVAHEEYYPDTFNHLNKIVPIEASQFFSSINVSGDKKHHQFEKAFTESKNYTLNVTEKYLCDFDVYAALSQYITTDASVNWHFGNSASIRYAQLFDFNKNANYFANRGVSGIEGCISTAIGVALAQPSKQNVLLIGDLAFYYNANALKAIPKNLKIILVNNAGGNIFRLIDGPSDVKGFDEYVEHHTLNNHSLLAQQYGLVYLGCNEIKNLKETLNTFFKNNDKALLEIFTDRLHNAETLKKHLKQFSYGKQEKLEDN